MNIKIVQLFLRKTHFFKKFTGANLQGSLVFAIDLILVVTYRSPHNGSSIRVHSICALKTEICLVK